MGFRWDRSETFRRGGEIIRAFLIRAIWWVRSFSLILRSCIEGALCDRGGHTMGWGWHGRWNSPLRYCQALLRMGWLDWTLFKVALTFLVKGESGGATVVRRLRVLVASWYLPRLAWA